MNTTADKLSRSARRWRTLRAQGRCTRCKVKLKTDRAKCDDCLSLERKRRAGFEIPVTRSSRFCESPLCDLLEQLGLDILYSQNEYTFTGSLNFVWAKRPGDTPFDALRAKHLIK